MSIIAHGERVTSNASAISIIFMKNHAFSFLVNELKPEEMKRIVKKRKEELWSFIKS